MKLSAFCLLALFATSAFASTDFNCQGGSATRPVEVSFIKGELSYNDGRAINVSVNNETVVGKTLTVSGVSRGLVFAGGGTQTVNVAVNLKTKKALLTIKTKTFYRQSETTYKLKCTL